ncbi:hypothetical protein MP638_006371 [Amoeboaphelidium occidentale]|nr:hypothetical protein MP638_006371 [Amoeboaphelidium occidentale]
MLYRAMESENSDPLSPFKPLSAEGNVPLIKTQQPQFITMNDEDFDFDSTFIVEQDLELENARKGLRQRAATVETTLSASLETFAHLEEEVLKQIIESVHQEDTEDDDEVPLKVDDLSKSLSHFDITGYEYSRLVDSSMEVEVRTEIPGVQSSPGKSLGESLNAKVSLNKCEECTELRRTLESVTSKFNKAEAELKKSVTSKFNKAEAELKSLKNKKEPKASVPESNLNISAAVKQIEEEWKKIRAEKKKLNLNRTLNSQLITKNERVEIEDLKKRIKELEGALKAKTLKQTLNEERQKRRIDELTRKNQEFEEQVKMLQKQQMDFKESNHAAGKRVKATESRQIAKQTKTSPLVKKSERYDDGRKIINYTNGSCKEIYPDGQVVTRYINGDLKHIMPDGSILYYFADSMITQTDCIDGVVIYEFPDGQTETRNPDGSVKIVYPDKTTRFISATGEEESVFADGTVCRIDAEGKKVVEFPSGTKEVYCNGMKQRIEADGTIRTVYSDGTREIKYPDGRIKVLPAAAAASLKAQSVSK